MTSAEALAALAGRIANAAWVGPEARDAARLRLFDTSIATVLGWRLAESAPLHRMAQGVHGRIRALVAATRTTEVDDIILSGAVTPGSVVVPAALVLASDRRIDTARLHEAIVCGYEAMAGFAAAIDGAQALYRGVWPTLAAGPIGSAAVASSILGLDEDATNRALALAICRSLWWMPQGLPRWLQLGHAAVDGVLAAEAAAAGFSAPADVWDGWAGAAGISLDPARLAPAERPHIFSAETKSFPTARQGLCAIQAFAQLHREIPVGASDRIDLALPSVYAAMVGGTMLPNGRMFSLVSAPYQMALLVHAPERLYDVGREELLSDSVIESFLGQVTVSVDPLLDALYPRVWPARVTIASPDGSTRMREVHDAEGGDRHPAGWQDLAAKARSLAHANALDPRHMVDLEEAVRSDHASGELLSLLI